MNRTHQYLLTCLALLVVHTVTAAGGPIFKCTINGSVTFQNTPCPVQETQTRPTAERLNTENKKRHEAETAKTTAQPSAPSGKQPTLVTSTAAAPRSIGSAGYRCDGRTYCSQMRSCQEAEFFLRNCPGVKMDGNHDGVPCEEQWCGR